MGTQAVWFDPHTMHICMEALHRAAQLYNHTPTESKTKHRRNLQISQKAVGKNLGCHLLPKAGFTFRTHHLQPNVPSANIWFWGKAYGTFWTMRYEGGSTEKSVVFLEWTDVRKEPFYSLSLWRCSELLKSSHNHKDTYKPTQNGRLENWKGHRCLMKGHSLWKEMRTPLAQDTLLDH